METLIKIIGAVVLVIIMAIVFAILLAIPVWLLWNWVAVTVLGLKVITLWQALGLALLSSLLFKSSTTVKKD